jgi:hypothetical protein
MQSYSKVEIIITPLKKLSLQFKLENFSKVRNKTTGASIHGASLRQMTVMQNLILWLDKAEGIQQECRIPARKLPRQKDDQLIQQSDHNISSSHKNIFCYTYRARIFPRGCVPCTHPH